MLLKKSITVAALSAISFSCSLAYAATVDIVNPGFENGFNDWREIESAAVSGDSLSGSKSAKLQNSTGQLRQVVDVLPNTEYELRAFVKGAGQVGVNTGSGTKSKKVSGQSDWTEVSVIFTSSSQSTVDLFIKYNGAEGRFDDFTLETTGSTPDTNPVTLPALIQAEDYTGFSDTTSGNTGGQYRNDDVDIQVTTDANGGYNVGWFNPGEYLEYDIEVNDSGNYKAQVRVATKQANAQFYLAIDGRKIGGNVNVPNRANWQLYSTVDVDLGNLNIGNYTLSIVNANAGINLNWINVIADGSSNNTSVNVPGVIQAEDYNDYYDRSSGNAGGAYRPDENVDIKATSDNGGGFQVGWFQTNEWLEYTINVTQAGNYEALVRAASNGSSGKYSLSVDGANVSGTQNIANTNNYNVFNTNTADIGFLSAGTHVLRFTGVQQYFDVNWIELKLKGDDPVNPPTAGDCNIDMSIWGYTLSDGRSKNNKSDIQDLVDNKNLGGDEIRFNDGCVTFKAPNIGTTSSGSSFVRSELRELVTMYADDSFDDTDIQNQWVTSRASNTNRNNAGGVDGKMTATLKVNTVSVDYSGDSDDQVGRIIVGQIHGVDHEPVKIYYQKMPDHNKGSVYFTVDGSNGKPIDRVYVIGYSDKDYEKHSNGSDNLSSPSNGIALGDEWSYEIDLSGNQLKVTVWHDGNIYTTADSIAYSRTQSRAVISNSGDNSAITIGSHYDNDLMYFKAGLYNQNNTGTQSPAYAEVTFYQIDVEHY